MLTRCCTSVLKEQDGEELVRRGGVQGFAEALHTDTSTGLSAETQGSLSLKARVTAFGANRFKEVKQKSLLSLIINNLQDPTLMLLMAAAMVCSCPAPQPFVCRPLP